MLTNLQFPTWIGFISIFWCVLSTFVYTPFCCLVCLSTCVVRLISSNIPYIYIPLIHYIAIYQYNNHFVDNIDIPGLLNVLIFTSPNKVLGIFNFQQIRSSKRSSGSSCWLYRLYPKISLVYIITSQLHDDILILHHYIFMRKSLHPIYMSI